MQGLIMNKLIWLLSWRYIKGIRTENNISVMLLTCFIAIFIGSFALALVASIMNGFERATCQKLRSIHSDIIMHAPSGQSLNFAAIKKKIAHHFTEIKQASPSSYKQIIIQKDGVQTLSNALFLKAIDPLLEKDTTTIEQALIKNSPPLNTILKDNTIIIGKTLAQDLGLRQGDLVHLLFIADQNVSGHKINLSSHDAYVAGIFDTGIEEFDAGIVYGTFELLQNLFPDEGIQQINISLIDSTNETVVINKLKKEFGLTTHSWKDYYKPLVQALKLEKYAMILILILIALVAIMNIISIIFMQIIKKRGDIALLLSIGMPHNAIQKLFIGIGVGITLIASLIGLLSAYIVGLILQKYPLIQLPDTYYMTHLPIHMEWWIFMGVFALMFIFSFLASYVPSMNIRSLKAAEILRFEG